MSSDAGPKIETSGMATRATIMEARTQYTTLEEKKGGGGLDLKMRHRNRKLVCRSGYSMPKEVNEHIFYAIPMLPQ